MEARAKAKNVKISSQKAKLVMDLIRGRNYGEAREILRYTNKRAAGLVYKVLERFRRHHAGDAPDCTDGVRLAWGDTWLHVRASGTEPLLRIIAESPEADRADALVEEATVFARRITVGHEGS